MKRSSGLHDTDTIRRILVLKNGGAGELVGGGGGGSNPPIQAKNEKWKNESSISELQDFKILWGEIPPDPTKGWCLRRSTQFKTRSLVYWGEPWFL